jgi:hypothetical protein
VFKILDLKVRVFKRIISEGSRIFLRVFKYFLEELNTYKKIILKKYTYKKKKKKKKKKKFKSGGSFEPLGKYVAPPLFTCIPWLILVDNLKKKNIILEKKLIKF